MVVYIFNNQYIQLDYHTWLRYHHLSGWIPFRMSIPSEKIPRGSARWHDLLLCHGCMCWKSSWNRWWQALDLWITSVLATFCHHATIFHSKPSSKHPRNMWHPIGCFTDLSMSMVQYFKWGGWTGWVNCVDLQVCQDPKTQSRLETEWLVSGDLKHISFMWGDLQWLLFGKCVETTKVKCMTTISTYVVPVVPHKAVAEVSRIGHYRRDWLLWVTGGRAKTLMDRTVQLCNWLTD